MSILKVKLIIANPTEYYFDTNEAICVHGQNINNVSEFYNTEFLKEPRSDIYGFLLGGDVLESNAISRVVKVFEKDLALTGLVYFDKFLIKNNDSIHNKNITKLIQLFPAFEAYVRTIFNPTVFINGHIKAPIFDPELNYLRNYDVIQKLSTNTKIIHIPEILISSPYQHVSIQAELENYVRKSST